MKLPVITTRGIIVFPGHRIQLDIGRMMSLNALDISTLDHNNNLILVSQRDVTKDNIESFKDIFDVGTLVSFNIEKNYENGAKTISVVGQKRIKISNLEIKNDQIITAETKPIKDKNSDEKIEKAFINQISKMLDKTMNQLTNVPKNVLSSLTSGISASELADVVAQYLPLNLAQKQNVLAESDVNKRLEKINKFLNEQSQISAIESGIDQNVKKTIDGQHKEFLLRERLKAIKEELGDISSKDSEVEKWREELQSDKFTESVKEAIEKEISKYEQTPPMAADSNVLRTYLDWVFSLPWASYSEDNNDIGRAKDILDKHHYGLKNVKERIIEHLAVMMNAKNSSSPIITLVGPPGVGKTSLAKSIAEAVGRKFSKVSLGGVRDEAEIRGHRKTYVGSMPGKIIQAIKKSKVSNPLILLDEIDKMASDYKGDPTSAMLEVLDPEQNKFFQDHYIELEYDLSKVMFLATANYYDHIPTPLLDRVELIFLDQYTSEEKLAIAKNYIIPKIIKDNGLKKSQFKISETTISYIIGKYTLEAGVRGLQRVMGQLARKIVVKKLKGEVKGIFTITKEKVLQMLGKEKVSKEKLQGKSEIGLAQGMYYSAVGGGIMPIEVTTYASKQGAIKLTGSVKDVMKESLQVAVAYIRANEKEFGINFNWEKNTIQIHVPAGATPKDGPSAGTAFTTAIISVLTKKPVPKTFALTGEITLRGKVLPIGGLKEKTLGAVEAGIRTIFIPKENTKDLDDLAKKVKEKAKIIPVEEYAEVFKYIYK